MITITQQHNRHNFVYDPNDGITIYDGEEQQITCDGWFEVAEQSRTSLYATIHIGEGEFVATMDADRICVYNCPFDLLQGVCDLMGALIGEIDNYINTTYNNEQDN